MSQKYTAPLFGAPLSWRSGEHAPFPYPPLLAPVTTARTSRAITLHANNLNIGDESAREKLEAEFFA